MQAVGSHGAASLRPALQRAAGHGQAAVRRAALTGAAQQKLILCSALLSEVGLAERGWNERRVGVAVAGAIDTSSAGVTSNLRLTPSPLKQVAHTFGFKLRISNPYGVNAQASPRSAPVGGSGGTAEVAVAAMTSSAAAHPVGEPSSPAAAAADGGTAMKYPLQQQLDVIILAEGEEDEDWEEDGAAAAEGDDGSARGGRRVSRQAAEVRP